MHLNHFISILSTSEVDFVFWHHVILDLQKSKLERFLLDPKYDSVAIAIITIHIDIIGSTGVINH